MLVRDGHIGAHLVYRRHLALQRCDVLEYGPGDGMAHLPHALAVPPLGSAPRRVRGASVPLEDPVQPSDPLIDAVVDGEVEEQSGEGGLRYPGYAQESGVVPAYPPDEIDGAVVHVLEEFDVERLVGLDILGRIQRLLVPREEQDRRQQGVPRSEIHIGFGDHTEYPLGSDEQVDKVHVLAYPGAGRVLYAGIEVVAGDLDRIELPACREREASSFGDDVPAGDVHVLSVRQCDGYAPDPIAGRAVFECGWSGRVAGDVPADGTVQLRRVHGIEPRLRLVLQGLDRPGRDVRELREVPLHEDRVQLPDGRARKDAGEVPSVVPSDSYDSGHPLQREDVASRRDAPSADARPHGADGHPVAFGVVDPQGLPQFRFVVRSDDVLGVAGHLGLVPEISGTGLDALSVEHLIPPICGGSWPL